MISPRQPQVGTELTAILTDEDNVAPGQGEWQWASSDSMTRPSPDDSSWEDIPARSGDRTYRPTDADLGKFLRATVEYVDRAGADIREVMAVSDYSVRVDTNTSNQDPIFPDQSTLTGVTTDLPAPVRGDTDRFIPETAAAGTNVGAPVTAFDDKTEVEIITYSLRDADGGTSPNGATSDDDGNSDTPAHNDGHAASFDIDAETGQITVSAGARLDADGTDGEGEDATNPYNVVVRAVDGDGDTQNIDVAIHVLEYHEPPVIDRVYQTDRVGEGHSVGDRVPTEFSHWEADRTPRSPTTLDADLESGVLDYSGGDPVLRLIGTGPASLIEAATYYATDPDADTTLTWSLEGDDADAFEIEPAENVSNVTLAFAAGPDFEVEGDQNTDNVYKVTIVVSDGTVDIDGNPHRDELPVTVKVINSAEDNQPGEVMLSNRVPEVGIPLTAEFSDTDTPIREMTWQWYRQAGEDTTANGTRCGEDRNPYAETIPPTDPAENVRYFIDIAPGLPEADVDWVAIPGATSATYTPGFDEDSGGTVDDTTTVGTEVWTGGDIDVVITTDADGGQNYAWTDPRCLRVAVTYRDAVDRTHAETDDATTRDVDETLEGTFVGSEYSVKGLDKSNDAPEFLDIAGDPISTYQADDIEDIAENTTASGTGTNYTLLIKNASDAINLAATDEVVDEPYRHHATRG